MKKVVHYSDLRYTPVVGKMAMVIPVDHPDTENVSNNTWVYTSDVVRVDEVTGIFETLNTVYEPVRVFKSKSEQRRYEAQKATS